MPLFEDTYEERTETPSQFRREEFRKQGIVAHSRELVSLGILLVTGFTLYLLMSRGFGEIGQLMRDFLSFSGKNLGVSELLSMRMPMLRSWGLTVAPVFMGAMLIAVLMSAIQVGFHISWEPLSPKWERINPIPGLSRIMSSSAAMEALKAVLKIGLVSVIIYFFISSHANDFVLLYHHQIQGQLPLILKITTALFFTIVVFFSGIAGIDFFFQRYQVEKQMRSTRREAKEEFKLREGDPLVKSRIRGIQRRLASRRMMEDVPKADVVVTNPTHLAVALRYDSQTMPAPKVTAKGQGIIAQKIRDLARKNSVPIVENKPLARTLYKKIEIGHSIPKELYKAVAEVLAYVYRLRTARQTAWNQAAAAARSASV